MRTTKRSLTIFAMLFSVLVFASACGSSNDPQSWAEAEDDGFGEGDDWGAGDDGFGGVKCELNCSTLCSDHGDCTEKGTGAAIASPTCICEAGYYGSNCSSTCPGGVP